MNLSKKKSTIGLVIAICCLIGIIGVGIAFSSHNDVKPAQITTGSDVIENFTAISEAVPVAQDVEEFSKLSNNMNLNSDYISNEFELDQTTADAIAALSENEQVQAIVEELKDNPVFEIQEIDGETIINKPFALKRIIVSGDIDVSGISAATAAVFDEYTNSTIITFDTMTDTYNAFAMFDTAGEEVMVDAPVYATGNASDYDGWGVTDMNLDAVEDALNAKDNLSSVKVAILDTGVNPNHQAFNSVSFDSASGTFSSVRTANRSNSAFIDDNGHGTMVSSIIASGTPDKVSLLELKCMDSTGTGSLYDVYYALCYAANNNADVVNLSLGANLGTGRSAKATMRAFDRSLKAVTDKGGIVIVAASNEGRDMDACGSYPAVSPYAYSVGALNQNGQKASYSNYGNSLDFVAPGTAIKGAAYDDNTSAMVGSGTSFAAPHIAAFAADLKTLYKDKNATDIASIMKEMSTDLGDSGFDKYYGYGKPVFDLTTITPATNKQGVEIAVVVPVDTDTNDNNASESNTTNNSSTITDSSEYSQSHNESNNVDAAPSNENDNANYADNSDENEQSHANKPTNEEATQNDTSSENTTNANDNIDENASNSEQTEEGNNENQPSDIGENEAEQSEDNIIPEEERTSIINGYFYTSGLSLSYVYTGEPIAPKFKVYEFNKGHIHTLIEGKDYTLTYENNTDLGWGKIIINGIGAYKDSAYVSFKIVKTKQPYSYYW